MTEQVIDFEDWYRQSYSIVLVAVGLICTGEIARAEDATNDAYMKALERWETVSNMQSPTAWVTKVAVNRAKRGLRWRTRHVELRNIDALTSQSDHPPDSGFWDVLSSLAPRQRQAIVLRYVEDMTQRHVAVELGVTEGTASATLSQARRALRSELQKES